MGVLASLLSSRTRAEVFRLLFGAVATEMHGRELARQSGCNEATIRQELRKLKRLDLVISRRSGNRVYYRANHAHPLHPEIHQLVLKTAGLVDIVKQAFSGAAIDVAFVFGSVAEGRPNAESDIDLMVLGDAGLRELVSLLSGVSEMIGREVNTHALTVKEYRRRLAEGDHFVTQVLSGTKLFVTGNQDDLEAMGAARVA